MSTEKKSGEQTASPPAVDKRKDLPEREQWGSRLSFILSCVGYAIGLGNVWRFPFLCYKNGGGTFLIPYFLALILGGIPMFFMEVAIGQSMSIGTLGIWRICPTFKGVGYAATIMAFWLNTFYIVVLAWAIFYFYQSFQAVLPWATCGNDWNTLKCITPDQMLNSSTQMNDSVSSASEYWENRALSMTSGIEDQGGLRWELAICLAIAWIMCYFCIWKGVKTTGNIVYFTSLFPYVLLFILLIRGVTLPGAWDGIKYLFIPDFTKLGNSEVWIDAVTQIFFSYGLGLGAVVALGSYNKHKTDCYRDTMILTAINEGTCFLASLVIFSVLGYMAKVADLPISEVADSGPGLAFVAYPNAINQLPISPVWSALFFLMIIFIGLDSQFCTMEGFITACVDEWPHLFKKRKELFIAAVCLVSYLIGLLNVTEGGIYTFNMFNTYAASGWALLTLMFFECIGIAWFYGASKFYEDIHDMIGYYPNRFWKWCWLYLTPFLCVSVALFSLIKYERFTYKDYQYPWWAELTGWGLAFSSMLVIPIFAIYKIIVTPGNIKSVMMPDISIRDIRKEKENEKHEHGLELL